MTSLYPPAMRKLINELTKLPSVGEKSAIRLAYHLVTKGRSTAINLSDILRETVQNTTLCRVCFFLSETEICQVCSSPSRNRNLLCVVEKPADVAALEQSGGFRGLYHVLHGLWSPLKGVAPEQTKIGELLRRLSSKGKNSADDPLLFPVEEVILAMGTTVEGDATALYVAGSIETLGIPVSRIAQGLPKGGELEYADQMTLHLSLENRRKF